MLCSQQKIPTCSQKKIKENMILVGSWKVELDFTSNLNLRSPSFPGSPINGGQEQNTQIFISEGFAVLFFRRKTNSIIRFPRHLPLRQVL